MRYFAPDAPTYVYRFFDAAGNLLYVGVAFDPEERWKAHRRTAWWPQAVESTVVLFPSRRGALKEEARAIAEEDPIFNFRPTGRATGHRRFGRLTASRGGRLIALDPRGVEITRSTMHASGLSRLDATLAEKCPNWLPGALVEFAFGADQLTHDQVEVFNRRWARQAAATEAEAGETGPRLGGERPSRGQRQDKTHPSAKTEQD